MGEDGTTYWDKTTLASYIYPTSHHTSSYRFRGYIVGDSKFINSFERLKNVFIRGFGTRSPGEEASLADSINALKDVYIRSYPLRSHIVNPLLRIAKFWGHSGSYYLHTAKGSGFAHYFTKVNKAIQAFLYFSSIVIGLGFLLVKVKESLSYLYLVVPFIAITITIPLFFMLTEARYGVSFYYPALVGLIVFVFRFVKHKYQFQF
jgi:hypothetical protein